MATQHYQTFYERLSHPWRGWSSWLQACNHALTGTVYLLYPGVLLYSFWKGGLGAIAELVIWPAMGFAFVTGLRKILNQPRPYESWSIQPLITKETSGQSFPSRHVFSAAVIGTVCLEVQIWLGLAILLLAVCLAILRVLGGVHYPKDVIAGFLLGMLLGLPVFF